MPIAKKAQRTSENRIELVSYNTTFPPIDAEEVVTLGYLVGLISANGGLKIGPIDAGIDEHYIEMELTSRLPSRDAL